MDEKDIVKRWNKDCQVLVGKTIVEVRYINDKEMNGLMWDRKSLAIFFKDGTYMIPSQDDEGNGPGALFTNIPDLSVIPVI